MGAERWDFGPVEHAAVDHAAVDRTGTINLTLLGPGLGPGPGGALGPKWLRALGPRGTPNP